MTRAREIVDRAPQCEHDLTSNETLSWKRSKVITDFRCQRSSRYRIDEKNYCKMHAGAVALEILVRMSR